mgnify:CR=1 FL=1
MKKYILTLAIVLSMGSLVNGQVEIKGLIGTNFSSLSSPPDGFAYAAKAGYQFGVGVLIGDKFYVEPGLQFIRKTKTITENTTDFDFSMNYVKIPVYAGYHLLGHESGLLALRLFAGPAITIPGKITKGEEQITKDDINNALFAVDAGLGLDILFLFVELSYEHSLSKFWTDETHESTQKGFLINAGVHIDF